MSSSHVAVHRFTTCLCNGALFSMPRSSSAVQFALFVMRLPVEANGTVDPCPETAYSSGLSAQRLGVPHASGSSCCEAFGRGVRVA